VDRIGNLKAAENKVLEDVNTLLTEVRSIVAAAPKSATEGVALLSQLRDIGYEDLNQIQHEYLILAAATWLVEKGLVPSDAEWYWHPRQTGGSDEPDLCAKHEGRTVLSAEITTSRRPIGTILDRMRTTLAKLKGLPGKKCYFVRTESMSSKAKTIVSAEGWKIKVVCLPHVAGEL